MEQKTSDPVYRLNARGVTYFERWKGKNINFIIEEIFQKSIRSARKIVEREQHPGIFNRIPGENDRPMRKGILQNLFCCDHKRLLKQ